MLLSFIYTQQTDKMVATHNCVSCRGIGHQGASMITTKASGVFLDNTNQARQEFFDSVKINTNI